MTSNTAVLTPPDVCAKRSLDDPLTLARIDHTIADAFRTMEGWCTADKGQRMARGVLGAAAQAKGRAPLCVELGVFGGRGVLAMGAAIQLGLRGQGRVHGIDPFTAAAALEGTNAKENQEWWSKLDYPRILQGARDALSRVQLDTIVQLIVHRSQDVISSYENSSIDVLHQDSNHSEEVSCHEVETWSPKMVTGGVWIFDDINWPSTAAAQMMLINKGFTLLETHETWAIYRAP